uniref:Uncharacterized protein n=1 Tax=Anguilla anguilla TaxID=7936 RepID=A0A0E9VDB8_ANGAN
MIGLLMLNHWPEGRKLIGSLSSSLLFFVLFII